MPGSFQYFPEVKTEETNTDRDRRSFFSGAYAKSDKDQCLSAIMQSRCRVDSLPSNMPSSIHWLNQIMEPQHHPPRDFLINDLDVSSEDAHFYSEDWENDFLLKRSTKPVKIPLTSCFTVADIPLLNFEDVKSLDDDDWSTSTSCSYTSPRSSERSIEIDAIFHGDQWSPDWKKNARNFTQRSHSVDVDMSPTPIDIELKSSLPQKPIKIERRDSVMDMETEMDLVQEYISENSNM